MIILVPPHFISFLDKEMKTMIIQLILITILLNMLLQKFFCYLMTFM